MILADLIGSRRVVFIKDEDGLYTEDPKKNPDADSIPQIKVGDLIARDQDDLVIERPCLAIIQNSEMIVDIQVINGMVPGNITRALEGEHVGSIISK